MTARLTGDIEAAARVLREGGLVAFPTETVYGLGAAALDPRAVARIFEAKERPLFDPLIVHVAAREEIRPLVRDVPPAAVRLADRFWPGPLTLVLPKSDAVPDIVTAGLATVGVRIPNHPVALQFLRAVRGPVAAPSANLFCRLSPTTAEHVLEQLGDRIDLVLDGGACRVGVESTVVRVCFESDATILRLGGVSVEDLEAEVGPVRVETGGDSHVRPQPAPGRIARHYAPRTPLMLVEDWSEAPRGSHVGALSFAAKPGPPGFGAVEILSPAGDLREAAARFFAALRRLDARGLRLIVAERLPETGLGRAINDRLRRASESGHPGSM